MVGPAPGKRGEGKGVACRRGGEVIWGWDRAVGYAPTAEARPEMKQSQLVPAKDGMLDEEEWVVVYGYDALFSALEFCICYITSSITHNDLTCHFWLCQKITCFLKFNLRFFFFFV